MFRRACQARKRERGPLLRTQTERLPVGVDSGGEELESGLPAATAPQVYRGQALLRVGGGGFELGWGALGGGGGRISGICPPKLSHNSADDFTDCVKKRCIRSASKAMPYQDMSSGRCRRHPHA